MSAFASIIGYENIKEELYRVCDTMKNPEKYNHFGVVTPRGVLFYGDPGVGKTMMAQALAKESGRKVFTIRKNMPDGEFVNFIKDSFENARKEDSAIVLLDDMDKFANEDSEHKRFLKHVIKALTKTEVLIWEDLEIIKEHVGV